MKTYTHTTRNLLFASCLAWFCGLPSVKSSEPMDIREWTSLNGQKLTARLAGLDDGLVLLRKEGELAPLRVPSSQLSAVDQKFLFLNLPLLVGEAAPPASPTSSASPISIVTTVAKSDRWPERFVAPNNIINANHYPKQSAAGIQLYGTTHFRYLVYIDEILSPSLMKEIARVFEGVYELMSQCPFGLSAQPNNRFFIAHLHPTMQSYAQAGGPPMSGGFYSSKAKEFHVPFESLGIVKKGDAWSRSQDFEVKTLVHELTHMMMHNLLPVLPMWLIEGSAEYMECIPLRSGIFQPPLVGRKIGNKRLGSESPSITYGRMLTITPSEWPSMSYTKAAAYRMSLLMTYYFMNLEGDGKGTKMKRFLDACREEAALYQDFVTNGVGGKSAYRDGTTASLHLNILLDGKDPEVVGKEIEAALGQAGIQF